jgi:fructose-1,6-bisphosphatase/inositol monophosphatase family enzyme
MDYSVEVDLARAAALAGGAAAMRHYRRSPAAGRKPDGSYVTVGDRAAETAIRERIAGAFPGHNIHGEEEGLTSARGGPPVEGAPMWVVDPIDGTDNYIAEIPVWASLVALIIDGDVVLGVAHAPALDETYEAARGMGAYLNSYPISVDEADLGHATVLDSG